MRLRTASRIKPSGPRTTDGSSGSDSRARIRDDGSRAMLVAVSVFPSRGAVGDETARLGAITVAVSTARAIDNTMRAPFARGTRTGSNPSSDASSVSPGRPVSTVNIPSPPVVSDVTRTTPSNS